MLCHPYVSRGLEYFNTPLTVKTQCTEHSAENEVANTYGWRGQLNHAQRDVSAQCRVFAWDANKRGAVPAKTRNAAGGIAGEQDEDSGWDIFRLNECRVERSVIETNEVCV